MGRSVDYLLPPDNRAERYRELANEAILQAQVTFDQQRRTEYLSMAASWFRRAVEAERAIRNEVAAEFGHTSSAQIEPTNPPEVEEQAKKTPL